MTDAVAIAIGGMQTASANAAEAADTISRVTARAASTLAPAPSNNENPAVINDTGAAPEDDLLQGVTEFRQAAEAYKANVKVVETLNRMQQDLVEALGWVPPGSDITPSKTANG
ncbi:MAG: hypothetical protein Q7S99_12725 [Parvibaculum sp.]|nr:hypothetical protein [Parvibaculum sp.]|tara:strand:- start:629 stop:970 length:342 start_codon:yes stop_codon:yes gene_type:complete